MSKHIQSLGGQWQLREAVPEGRGKELDEWMPADVPGSVHVALLDLDRIPDPFVGANELDVQWVAESDWLYRRTFEVDAELLEHDRVFLVCDGLDTLADVAVNGERVGHAENAFRQYRWDVTSLLEEERNEILITFHSPVEYIRPRQEERRMYNPTHSISGAPYIRKAPCQFGWDWGPKLPPIGIWKDIRLEGASVARLEDVHLRQRHVDDGVIVSVDVGVERWETGVLEAVLRVTAPDGATLETDVVIEEGAATTPLEVKVEEPQLWWPNGYGAQPLYTVEVELVHGEIECDRQEFEIGLRTIELRQEPDEFGRSFEFVINGVPIFAKGANWIPADSFPTRIGDQDLEHLIRSSAQAHMNMLRVWGGGFYEEERFYDLCDRYGILVWQDFIFSCSTYPTDEAFFENVRVEAVQNIRRLRHRASLALWCGNNEMEWGWVRWGWDKPENEDLKEAYDRMFHHFLPEICASEDPDRAYWPSSPSSNVPFVEPNGEEKGDAHYWEVWHGRQPFSAYREQYPRFMSEFGFQSLPPYETVRAFADEGDLNLTSYVMEHHQRSGTGNELIIAQMADSFRIPKDFEAMCYLSLILQAEGIRYGVEHWRRNKHRVSGTLYWQLNDCWPAVSWSSIDYFGRWKALHYAARRFFAPVLLSAEEEGTEVTLHVTSDRQETWEGKVHWSLETLAGEVLADGSDTVSVEPLASEPVQTLDFSSQVDPNNRRDLVLVYELWQDDDRLSMDVLSFAPPKHVKLQDPVLTVDVREADDAFELALSVESLARFVWLELDGVDAVFSDNGFDLPPNREVTVTLPKLKGWTVEQVEDLLRVRSLVDSY